MALDIFNVMSAQGIDPGLYNLVQPAAQQVVSNFGRGRNLTEADINRMTNEVVSASQRRGLAPNSVNNRAFQDFIRLLILLNLYNYGYNMNPFWLLYFGGIPFFLLPFIGGGRPPARPVPPIERPPVRPMPPIGRPPVRPMPPIGWLPGLPAPPIGRPPMRPMPPMGRPPFGRPR